MQGLEPKEGHTICLANLSQQLRLSQSMCPRREGLNNLVFRECLGNPFPTRGTQNLLRSSFSVSEEEDMHIVKRSFVAHGPLVLCYGASVQVERQGTWASCLLVILRNSQHPKITRLILPLAIPKVTCDCENIPSMLQSGIVLLRLSRRQ